MIKVNPNHENRENCETALSPGRPGMPGGLSVSFPVCPVMSDLVPRSHIPLTLVIHSLTQGR